VKDHNNNFQEHKKLEQISLILSLFKGTSNGSEYCHMND